MKIIFFGSTNLALPVMEALRKQHELVAVVTTPDAESGRKRDLQETPVSTLARDLKLNLLKPESLKNNSDFFSQLQNLQADIFVVVAYGKLLPPEYINLPKYKILNLHPSALPKYRGPSPIRSALLNGDEFTAVTFIILDEEMDHGPILAQQVVKIDPDDNDFILTDKLAHAGASMVNEVIGDYVSGKTTPLPQDHEHATITKFVSKEDGRINWQKTSAEIYNQFRAFYPWPGIWTEWSGKKLKITDCMANTDLPIESGSTRLALGEPRRTDAYGPGTVLEGGKIMCGGNTILQIKSLQPEGKSDMQMADFLNGYRDFTGSALF